MLGLRLVRGKVKEAVICLGAGRVTLPYPFAPADPAEGFRGLPEVDPNRCIGCGGCASVCPSHLITIEDRGPVAIFTWTLARCTYCARCAEVCAEKAVSMSPSFESATGDVGDLTMTVEVFMGSCNRCGRCYRNQTPIDPPHPRPHHEERVSWFCERLGQTRTAPAEEVVP